MLFSKLSARSCLSVNLAILGLGMVAALTSLPSIDASAESGEIHKSKQHKFRVVTVAKGLRFPWSIAFLPGGDMLVTERAGRLRLIHDGKLDATPISGLPDIFVNGQGGLLDIALHPDFVENRLVYIAYASGKASSAGTEVARARLDLEKRRLENVETIFRVEPRTRGAAHYGGRLLFAPDGALFVTLGDRYRYMQEAQSLATHLGTIVRIKDDGGIPEDNPFVGRKGAKPEIYSYGHRNVQGIALRPGSMQIWAHEHGPRGGDELNLLKPGANYGWPAITYGVDYSGAIISDKTEAPGMEQPVVYWVPSIAPSGMTFYSGDKFPEWRGDIFLGALAHRHLRRLELDGDKVVEQEVLLKGLNSRIRDVRESPDGYLYVLTDAVRGRVLRIEPVEE